MVSDLTIDRRHTVETTVTEAMAGLAGCRVQADQGTSVSDYPESRPSRIDGPGAITALEADGVRESDPVTTDVKYADGVDRHQQRQFDAPVKGSVDRHPGLFAVAKPLEGVSYS